MSLRKETRPNTQRPAPCDHDYRGYKMRKFYIKCPFCGLETIAFWHSLQRNGKRCATCRAVHKEFESTISP